VDGWQLLQQLRADPDLQGVPIVVCSVLNEPEMAQALGAHYYLKKPASQQQLLATLRLALAGNSPAQRRRAER
jgi:CheY-like chemotaxis protein